MSRKATLVGPWGNREAVPERNPPEGAGALDFFGKALEAATGGPSTATVAISVRDVQALGRALRRVAAGEDARHVFAQTRAGYDLRERQRKGTIALLYWRTLAELLEAGRVSEREAKRQAITRAQRRFPRRTIDDASVAKYARAHRDLCLMMLEVFHKQGKGPSLAPLRRYLARHSHKGRDPD